MQIGNAHLTVFFYVWAEYKTLEWLQIERVHRLHILTERIECVFFE